MSKFRSDVSVELVQSMCSEEVIVMAAQASTLGSGSRPDAKKVKGLIPWLVKHLHSVPLEHTAFTFRIEAPIFVTRQILKHRISSISEESGRYRELDTEYYVPSKKRKTKQIGKTGDYHFVDDKATNFWARHALRIGNTVDTALYRFMIKMGVSKEVARMKLPVNTYSTLFITMNLRSWLNFMALRKDWGDAAAVQSHPQHEVELVAQQIEEVLKEAAPSVWKGFVDGGYRAV